MPNSAKNGGIRTELAERVREERAELAADRQLALDLGGALRPVECAPDDDRPAELLDTGDGRPAIGRPPGTLNVAPLEVRRYLLATAGNPLLRLARLANASTLDLARLLGCKPFELLQLQATCARYLLPYVASAMPAKIELSARQWLALGMFNGADPSGTVPSAILAAAEDQLAELAGLRPAAALAGRALGDVELVEQLAEHVEPAAAEELEESAEAAGSSAPSSSARTAGK